MGLTPSPARDGSDAHLLKPDKVDGLAPATSLAKRTLDVAVARTPWLGLFLTGLLLCASVMHHFEKLLAKRVELAFFVPMLIGHGGNSGVQAVSNVIRSIAVDGSAHPAKMLTVESAAGLLQSIVLSAFIAPALRFSMNIPMPVCIVVALSLPALGFFANTCGAALPYIAVRVGLDPAVVVGPMMTTLVDTVGVLIYLSIAMAILGDLDDASGVLAVPHKDGANDSPYGQLESTPHERAQQFTRKLEQYFFSRAFSERAFHGAFAVEVEHGDRSRHREWVVGGPLKEK